MGRAEKEVEILAAETLLTGPLISIFRNATRYWVAFLFLAEGTDRFSACGRPALSSRLPERNDGQALRREAIQNWPTRTCEGCHRRHKAKAGTIVDMPDEKSRGAPTVPRKPRFTNSNRKRANELLPGDGHILDSVLEVVFDGAYFVDTQRRILKWNAGASSLTGFSDRDVLGHCCYDNILMHVDGCGVELCKYGCPLQKTLDDGQSRRAAVYLRHKHGYRVPVSVRTVPITDDDGKVVGALETFRVTDEPDYWKARTAELEGMAFIDQVTSIPNRRFLESQLDRLLHEFQYIHEPFILGMLDLDHFKLTNDKHGHQIGDGVLRRVGQTLLNCMRGTDIIGRWGGDEFVVLLPRTNLTKARQILERARLMVAESATPIEGGILKTSVSIGAVIVTREDDQVSLLQKADRQLYLAKQQGRNYCCLE